MTVDHKAAFWRDVVWLIILASVWGSSFSAIKIAVHTMPPMSLVAVRTAIALVVLYPIMWWRGARMPKDLPSWGIGFALGIFGITLPFFLIGWGEQRVESGLAAILMAVMPLTTIVLAHFFNEGDRFTLIKLIGVAVGFGGVIALIGPEALKGLGGDLLYQLGIAAGACCYAVNAVLTRNLGGVGTSSSTIGRATMVMLCGTILSVLMALVMDGPMAFLSADADAWVATIYIGILPTGLATLIFFRLVEAQGASFISFVNYLNPVFGVFWGALILTEAVSLQSIAALTLILGGITIANIRRP